MRFSDVLMIKNGRNQKQVENPNGLYPIYGSGGIMGRADAYICEAGTVAIGRKGTINNPIFVDEPFWNVDTAFGLVANKDILLPKYLYYFCCNYNFESLNTTVTIPSLTKANLLNVEISIPPIHIQKHIVDRLDKGSELITLRNQQLIRLDDLVKSRFVEMFGDPDCNPNNWIKTTIGNVIQSCEAGWSGNGTQREKKPGEIAVLKVSAVTKGFFIPEECKVLDNQSEIKKYVFPQKGDLLFSRANTREMVGATAIILQDYPELVLPDKLWKIRFISCANVLYMKHILSHPSIRAKFSEASTGTSGSMFNVSMEKFKAIVVPLPPIELQEQFAAFIEQTDKSKFDFIRCTSGETFLRYFGSPWRTASLCLFWHDPKAVVPALWAYLCRLLVWQASAGTYEDVPC